MTMKELAARLQLSQSTVSKVLNNKGSKVASPEVIRRIRAEALKCNFVPDRAAAMLRRGKSNTIGVLLPSPKNVYYAEIVSDIHHALMGGSYCPVFSFWEKDSEMERARDTLISWNVDAILTVEPQLIPDSFTKPVVSFYKEDSRFDCVLLDHQSAVRQILHYLQGLGHYRICWCGSNNAIRKKLLERLAPEMGLELLLLTTGKDMLCVDSTAGRHLAENLVKDHQASLPTALIAHNDNVAMGLIRRLHELGHRIPEDFSVVGQDNLSFAQNMIPSISTVHYYTREPIGKFLADRLLDCVQESDKERMVHQISASLIVRESSGKAKTV